MGFDPVADIVLIDQQHSPFSLGVLFVLVILERHIRSTLNHKIDLLLC